MANDPQPHPNAYNTAKQVRRDTDDIKNFIIKLYDIDLAVIEYMNNVISPEVNLQGESGPKFRVPVIYGSAERWASARKFGFVRDQHGQVQLPLIMIRRNSVQKDDQFRTLNRHITTTFQPKYSPKNRYDVFSLMQGVAPTKESYTTIFPDHVTLSYECVAWTSFTEHLNDIIERFNWADDDYWGYKDKYKFRASIDNFNISNELAGNSERLVRATFNLSIRAYLLPPEFAEKITTIKSFTPKRILLMTELDVSNLTPSLTRYSKHTSQQTLGRVSTPKVSMITEYQRLFDFITLSNTYAATYVSSITGSTAVFNVPNVVLIQTPTDLSDLISDDERFVVFINGITAPNTTYTVTQSGNSVDITFNNALLKFNLSESDEVIIRGKIQSV